MAEIAFETKVRYLEFQLLAKVPETPSPEIDVNTSDISAPALYKRRTLFSDSRRAVHRVDVGKAGRIAERL